MPHNRTIPMPCAFCGMTFYADPYDIKIIGRKYCSHTCARRDYVVPIEDRMLDKRLVDPGSGCWLYLGLINPGGYGSISFEGMQTTVHRVAMHLWRNFDILDSRMICHKCNVRACFNPDHLYAGTAADNSRDMLQAGTYQYGVRHFRARLTDDDIPIIRARRASGETQTSIARAFNVNQGTISAVISGRTWRHVT